MQNGTETNVLAPGGGALGESSHCEGQVVLPLAQAGAAALQRRRRVFGGAGGQNGENRTALPRPLGLGRPDQPCAPLLVADPGATRVGMALPGPGQC